LSSGFDPDINIEVKFTRGQRPAASHAQHLAVFARGNRSVPPSPLQVCIIWSRDSMWLDRAESISWGWARAGLNA